MARAPGCVRTCCVAMEPRTGGTETPKAGGCLQGAGAGSTLGCPYTPRTPTLGQRSLFSTASAAQPPPAASAHPAPSARPLPERGRKSAGCHGASQGSPRPPGASPGLTHGGGRRPPLSPQPHGFPPEAFPFGSGEEEAQAVRARQAGRRPRGGLAGAGRAGRWGLRQGLQGRGGNEQPKTTTGPQGFWKRPFFLLFFPSSFLFLLNFSSSALHQARSSLPSCNQPETFKMTQISSRGWEGAGP